MSHGSGREWDNGNDIPVRFSHRHPRYTREIDLRQPPRSGASDWQHSHPRSGSERFRLDHGNDLPVPFSRLHSRYSGDQLVLPLSLRSGSSDWQHNTLFPWLSSQQTSGAGFGTLPRIQQFEETSTLRPRTRSTIGVPFEPYSRSSVQIISNDNMDRETSNRTAPFPRDIPSRFQSQGDNRQITQYREEATKLEQEKVLKMLKKEIYSSKPKNLLKRMSLYYKNAPGGNSSAINKDPDEDSKKCAVCLDEFEPGTEVMVTPCAHIFHEECIVPWAKSHGQCPVCRFVMSEQLKADAMALSSRNASTEDPIFAQHLESVIRALDEAFMWERLR